MSLLFFFGTAPASAPLDATDEAELRDAIERTLRGQTGVDDIAAVRRTLERLIALMRRRPAVGSETWVAALQLRERLWEERRLCGDPSGMIRYYAVTGRLLDVRNSYELRTPPGRSPVV